MSAICACDTPRNSQVFYLVNGIPICKYCRDKKEMSKKREELKNLIYTERVTTETLIDKIMDWVARRTF